MSEDRSRASYSQGPQPQKLQARIVGRLREMLSPDGRRVAGLGLDDVVLDGIREGIVVWSRDQTIRQVSRSAERMFGRSGSELRGQSFRVLLAESWQAAYDRRIARWEATGEKSGLGRVLRLDGARGDGSTFPMELVVTERGRDEDAQLVGVFRDVTDRVQAEEAARRSRVLLQLLDHLPDGVVIHGLQGRVTYTNRRLLDMLDYDDADDVVGRDVLEFVHPDDRKTVQCLIERMAQTNQPTSINKIRLLRRDGGTVTSQSAAVPVAYGGEKLVVAICRDVGEIDRLQSRAALADRMTSVGTLAAGVAHGINNPLAYVIGNLVFAGEELDELREEASATRRPRGEVRERLMEVTRALSQAKEGAERIRDLVSDLGTFARDDERPAQTLELHGVLDSAINMSWNEIRHRARLVTDYGDAPRIEADESRIAHVFLNLLLNAAQAIPEGDAERNEIRVRTWTDPSGRAGVEIQDTGEGIPGEIMERIFEPFYTTKPVGVGTGLGLSIAHGIVRDLGGEIEVESEVGRGTSFRVVLPASRRSRDAAKRRKSRGSGESRMRLLVVDDEPALLESMRRLLASTHDVHTVTTGREALARINAGEGFDAILCDLMMPEMTGMDLHERLERDHPELARRTVFLTGGAFTARAREFLDRIPNPRVEKPFDRATLSNALRSL